MCDIIVAGSGIAGAVAARRLAEAGLRVLVAERRNHVGGNCYDRLDAHGIRVHRYGPHIFHTDRRAVFDFLSRFTDWNGYRHEVAARVGEKYLPVPFNLNSVDMAFPPEEAAAIQSALIADYGMEARVSILALMEREEPPLRRLADYVYRNVFEYYTRKQWGLAPGELSPEVTARVPVLVSRDDRYFQDHWQGMPKDGYAAMFERMLDHKNIELRLNTDVREVIDLEDCAAFRGQVLLTGAVDELMSYRYGRLPYRTLDFDSRYFEEQRHQPKPVVNYTASEAYTRATEYKYLTGCENARGTTVVYEYSRALSGDDIPYYPVETAESLALYRRYAEAITKPGNVHLLGRLAEYRYYNIDAAAERALQLTDALTKRFSR